MKHLSTNRVYALLLLWITILLGIFLAKPMYETYMSREIEFASLEIKKEEKESKLKDLEILQKSFAKNSTWTTELIEKVNKIWKVWDTTEIFSAIMLNDFTRASSLAPARVSIGDISVDKWSNLPSWLSLWSVNFSVTANSLDDMIDFITHLTQTSEYTFTIDSIALPIDTWEVKTGLQSELSLSLALGIYYYE